MVGYNWTVHIIIQKLINTVSNNNNCYDCYANHQLWKLSTSFLLIFVGQYAIQCFNSVSRIVLSSFCLCLCELQKVGAGQGHLSVFWPALNSVTLIDLHSLCTVSCSVLRNIQARLLLSISWDNCQCDLCGAVMLTAISLTNYWSQEYHPVMELMTLRWFNPFPIGSKKEKKSLSFLRVLC